MVRRTWAGPDPRLRSLLGDYRHYRDPGSPPRRHVPSDDLTVIFNLVGDLRIKDPDGRARCLRPGDVYVGGLQTGCAATFAGGAQSGIIVGLSPIGAHRLLGGLPQEELVDRSLLLEDCEDFVQRLREAPDDSECFALLDAFFMERTSRATECESTSWAWTRLVESRGCLKIDELVQELGWSRKRLVDRFRQHVGLTPKRAARLLRFDHAVELSEEGRMGLAEIAATCGYSDQAHLSREVREFSGLSPRELAVRPETNLQDS